jgi:hypothetical protein
VPRRILKIELINFNSYNLFVSSKGTKEQNTSHDELSLISGGYRRQEEKVDPVSGKKGKAIPLQAWRGFQETEAPRFHDNRHMKVVRLSALRTSRLYPPGNIPGSHFVRG